MLLKFYFYYCFTFVRLLCMPSNGYMGDTLKDKIYFCYGFCDGIYYNNYSRSTKEFYSVGMFHARSFLNYKDMLDSFEGG